MGSDISVITPIYNAKKFLPRLIENVQNQHGVLYEHIIVDDCSTDGSLDIIQTYAAWDKRIKYVRLSKNSGAAAARNAAIKYASGRFLAFLDADDLWMPKKLEIQFGFMLKNEIALSYTDYRFISENGDKIGRLLRTPKRIGWNLHHMTRYVGCLTVMIDREKCPNFSFGDISSEYRAEDFLAWSKVIASNGCAVRCPGDLARYTVAINSRSRNGVRAAKSVWKLYRDIEKFDIFFSVLYFASYILFSSLKRFYCYPRLSRNNSCDIGLIGE